MEWPVEVMKEMARIEVKMAEDLVV